MRRFKTGDILFLYQLESPVRAQLGTVGFEKQSGRRATSIALLKSYERKLKVAVSWWLLCGLSDVLSAFCVFSKIVTVVSFISVVRQIIKVIE